MLHVNYTSFFRQIYDICNSIPIWPCMQRLSDSGYSPTDWHFCSLLRKHGTNIKLNVVWITCTVHILKVRKVNGNLLHIILITSPRLSDYLVVGPMVRLSTEQQWTPVVPSCTVEEATVDVIYSHKYFVDALADSEGSEYTHSRYYMYHSRW